MLSPGRHCTSAEEAALTMLPPTRPPWLALALTRMEPPLEAVNAGGGPLDPDGADFTAELLAQRPMLVAGGQRLDGAGVGI
mmetsp:Transcript_16751/g.53555  ORF Transcript_16751/g.53555 Transcript_16751/m.53555 type:complete len:81 (+) Transcript_16751:1084-1326(+)